MKTNILGLSVALLLSSVTFANDMSISSGWQIKGTESGFSNIESFNQSCITSVWSYDTTTNQWRAYSPDSNIQQLIDNNTDIATLTKINSDDGFWVNANSSCSIVKDTNTTTTYPTVIYQTNALWPSTTNFTLGMISNQTFNILSGYGLEYSVTFDSQGSATVQNPFPQNYDQYGYPICSEQSNDMYLTFTNDTLKMSWSENNTSKESEFKLLVTNENIGYIAVERYFDNYSVQYLENIYTIFLNTATPTPVDMSTKLPYYMYDTSSYGITQRVVTKYDTNGTSESYYNGSWSTNSNPFTIENGKLTMFSDYNSTNYESHSKYSIQTIYSIGDFDILQEEYNSTSKTNSISYNYDINGSSQYETVDLNSSIVTFEDLFNLTGNRLYSNLYDINNDTFTNSYQCSTQGFTLSTDKKTLTHCSSNTECEEMTLENGFITTVYSGSYKFTVKTKPIF